MADAPRATSRAALVIRRTHPALSRRIADTSGSAMLHQPAATGELTTTSTPSVHASSPARRAPYRGAIGHDMACTTCAQARPTRLEPFSVFSVLVPRVQGSPVGLERLLALIGSPEAVEGVHCDNCSKLSISSSSHALGGNINGGGSGSDSSGGRARHGSTAHQPTSRTFTKCSRVVALPSMLCIHFNRCVGCFCAFV